MRPLIPEPESRKTDTREVIQQLKELRREVRLEGLSLREPPDETRACFQQKQPAFVGSYPAGRGPFGTLDQTGNVWEWCRDAWDENAYAKPEHADEAVDPVLDSKDAYQRVLRGGGWVVFAEHLRAAYRIRDRVWVRSIAIGFRVAAVPRAL